MLYSFTSKYLNHKLKFTIFLGKSGILNRYKPVGPDRMEIEILRDRRYHCDPAFYHL